MRDSNEDIFIQDNYYFLCDAKEELLAQRLDDYESEEGFTLEYVEPNHAVSTNRYADHSIADPIMVEREAKVLEIMIKEGVVMSPVDEQCCF